jgi:hypothetical protein
VPEIERFASGSFTGDIADCKFLKAAFENELEEGGRANPARTTDDAQFHRESPRRMTIETPGAARLAAKIGP